MDKYQISSTGRFMYEKHEQNFRLSKFSGLYLYPGIIIMKIIFYCNYVTIGSVVIATYFYYRNKHKWRFLIQAILYLAQQVQINNHCIYSHIFTCITNLVLVPYWPMQVLFQIGIIRQLNHIYILCFFVALMRAIEILKRFLYSKICNINSHKYEQDSILLNLPHHILYFDENLNELFSNKSIKFNQESQQILSNYIKRKYYGIIQLENQEKEIIDYYIKPWQGNFILIQSHFFSEENSFFEQMYEQINKLYVQLNQDYTKWNNLRAFRMIKESDLSVLGQCLSECLHLEHQVRSIMKNLKQEICQFYLKVSICNIIESMVLKLYEHFNIINLNFESGIPEIVAGDKKLLLFIIQTLLTSTQFCDKQKGQLSIKCIIQQINQEKSGYDLEFTFNFTCTPSVIKLYSQVFGVNENKLNPNEEWLIHSLKKCKQLMKQNQNEFNFQTDGDNVIITFTFLSLISSNKLEQISQFTDLTFTRSVLDDCHYQWKEKIQILPTKFILDSKSRKSLPAIKKQQTTSSYSKVSIAFPEIRDDVVFILETALQDAKEKGLLDQFHFDYQDNNFKCAVSEYADSIANSPPSFITPQVQRRKLQNMAKEKFKNLLKEALKPKKKKRLSKRDCKVVFPRKNDTCCDLQCGPSKINFHNSILTNRSNRAFIKWTHRCNITQPPKTVHEILCYIPEIKLSKDLIKNFGNSTYDKIEIKDPIIVLDIADVIRIYKQYLQQGKQFYYIMLFVKKPQEIADFADIVQKNEQDLVQLYPKYQQTYLIGITEQSLKPSLYAYLKYIIPFGQWSIDIKQIKALIAKQREIN
ncbi:unnamed protein product [Paramecium pentaurelia]|uniref:Transmembrane protein n=1 Tax=Paramecium pentaurelia TaxID=43138 RepID=A0A8S1TMG4_9CILI|nr:unnamed protein product [Paramecium pentaurelia]